MNEYAPIDADGHVMETDDELRRYLPAPFEGRRALTALFPSLDGWPRSTRKAPDSTPGLQKWRMFLDRSGVAGSVLYPTMGLAMVHIKDVKWAAVMARCYNDYLYGEYLQKEPQRLWGVALLPVQDVGAAAEELERCVKELKMVGGVIPAAGLPKGLGHQMFDPLFQTAARLNVPLTVHGGSSAGLGLDLYDSFIKILVMEHAVAQQIHFTSYILDGAPVRFPTLKMAFLEAGVGWVPYLMERLDEKYEKLPQQAAAGPRAQPLRQELSDLFFLRARREDPTLCGRPRIGREDYVSVRLSARAAGPRRVSRGHSPLSRPQRSFRGK
jgi:uncharacterized protein